MKQGRRRSVFLTFGGGQGWPDAARRLVAQARAAQVFDRTILETSETFFKKNGDFLKHRPFIEANPRGWGYWIWKPFLILKHLRRLDEGDVLFYLDAGCEILPENSAKLAIMLEHAAQTGSLLFDYAGYPAFNAVFWSKQSLISEIQGEFGLADHLRTPSAWAGGVAFAKNVKSIAFLEDWLRYCTMNGYHLVDDTPSLKRQAHLLIEHRHDQAILSWLRAAYRLPAFCNVRHFDYVESIGVDLLQEALSQPFLTTRNRSGLSAVEHFRRFPGPAGHTSSSCIFAENLAEEQEDLLREMGLLQD